MVERSRKRAARKARRGKPRKLKASKRSVRVVDAPDEWVEDKLHNPSDY
jgi:hypothetical protein